MRQRSRQKKRITEITEMLNKYRAKPLNQIQEATGTQAKAKAALLGDNGAETVKVPKGSPVVSDKPHARITKMLDKYRDQLKTKAPSTTRDRVSIEMDASQVSRAVAKRPESLLPIHEIGLDEAMTALPPSPEDIQTAAGQASAAAARKQAQDTNLGDSAATTADRDQQETEQSIATGGVKKTWSGADAPSAEQASARREDRQSNLKELNRWAELAGVPPLLMEATQAEIDRDRRIKETFDRVRYTDSQDFARFMDGIAQQESGWTPGAPGVLIQNDTNRAGGMWQIMNSNWNGWSGAAENDYGFEGGDLGRGRAKNTPTRHIGHSDPMVQYLITRSEMKRMLEVVRSLPPELSPTGNIWGDMAAIWYTGGLRGENDKKRVAGDAPLDAGGVLGTGAWGGAVRALEKRAAGEKLSGKERSLIKQYQDKGRYSKAEAAAIGSPGMAGHSKFGRYTDKAVGLMGVRGDEALGQDPTKFYSTVDARGRKIKRPGNYIEAPRPGTAVRFIERLHEENGFHDPTEYNGSGRRGERWGNEAAGENPNEVYGEQYWNKYFLAKEGDEGAEKYKGKGKGSEKKFRGQWVTKDPTHGNHVQYTGDDLHDPTGPVWQKRLTQAWRTAREDNRQGRSVGSNRRRRSARKLRRGELSEAEAQMAFMDEISPDPIFDRGPVRLAQIEAEAEELTAEREAQKLLGQEKMRAKLSAMVPGLELPDYMRRQIEQGRLEAGDVEALLSKAQALGELGDDDDADQFLTAYEEEFGLDDDDYDPVVAGDDDDDPIYYGDDDDDGTAVEDADDVALVQAPTRADIQGTQVVVPPPRRKTRRQRDDEFFAGSQYQTKAHRRRFRKVAKNMDPDDPGQHPRWGQTYKDESGTQFAYGYKDPIAWGETADFDHPYYEEILHMGAAEPEEFDLELQQRATAERDARANVPIEKVPLDVTSIDWRKGQHPSSPPGLTSKEYVRGRHRAVQTDPEFRGPKTPWVPPKKAKQYRQEYQDTYYPDYGPEPPPPEDANRGTRAGRIRQGMEESHLRRMTELAGVSLLTENKKNDTISGKISYLVDKEGKKPDQATAIAHSMYDRGDLGEEQMKLTREELYNSVMQRLEEKWGSSARPFGTPRYRGQRYGGQGSTEPVAHGETEDLVGALLDALPHTPGAIGEPGWRRDPSATWGLNIAPGTPAAEMEAHIDDLRSPDATTSSGTPRRITPLRDHPPGSGQSPESGRREDRSQHQESKQHLKDLVLQEFHDMDLDPRAMSLDDVARLSQALDLPGDPSRLHGVAPAKMPYGSYEEEDIGKPGPGSTTPQYVDDDPEGEIEQASFAERHPITAQDVRRDQLRRRANRAAGYSSSGHRARSGQKRLPTEYDRWGSDRGAMHDDPGWDVDRLGEGKEERARARADARRQRRATRKNPFKGGHSAPGVSAADIWDDDSDEARELEGEELTMTQIGGKDKNLHVRGSTGDRSLPEPPIEHGDDENGDEPVRIDPRTTRGGPEPVELETTPMRPGHKRRRRRRLQKNLDENQQCNRLAKLAGILKD